MKGKLTIILFGLLTLGLRIPESKIIIGTITTDLKNKDNILGLLIELKHDSTVVSQTSVEPDGNFTLKADITQDLDLFYRGIGITETYLTTVKQTSFDTLKFNFVVPRHYKKFFGKVECPKCGKRDETVLIRYGLQSAIVVQQISKSGDTTYVPYDKKNYFDGGCVTSEIDPQWYCKRDRIKF